MQSYSQIKELQERIDSLKSQKVVSKTDEFLIKVWERSILILKNQHEQSQTDI